MSGSFQDEIPPSRVNIRYVKDTGGAQEELELPLKLLVLGDFTMKDDATPLEERSRVSIDKNNFGAVFKDHKLSVDLVVPNTLAGEGDLALKLDFQSLDDFTPTGIAGKIPELAMMLEARNLLKDLKAKVISNRDFRKHLENIVKDRSKMESVISELDKIAPVSADKEE